MLNNTHIQTNSKYCFISDIVRDFKKVSNKTSRNESLIYLIPHIETALRSGHSVKSVQIFAPHLAERVPAGR